MAHRSLVRRWTYTWTRVAAWLVGVVFFGVRCHGRENWPTEGSGLVCANHQSFFDPVLIGSACDRRLNYLARVTLFRFTPLSWLMSWYDAIPIQREGIGIGGLKEALRRLRRGEMVLIFPEGTRTHDGRPQPLQKGFCAVARRAQAPLVPVGIDGAFDAWPREQNWPRPASIHMSVGPVIPADRVSQLTDEELTAELGDRIQGCWEAARRSRRVAGGEWRVAGGR